MEFLEGGGWLSKFVRWYLAVVGVWIIWELISGAYASGEVIKALGLCLVAFATLIVVGLLILPELLHFAAEPLLIWIDSLFFPRGRLGKPPVDYRLTDFYMERGEYEKLADAHEEHLRNHPRELRPYVELIVAYRHHLGEPVRAKKLLVQARRKLSQKDFAELDAMDLG